MPKNFKKFMSKLLNKYLNENVLVDFKDKLYRLETSRKIRKLFLLKLDIEQLDHILKALQNYTKKCPITRTSQCISNENCAKNSTSENSLRENFIKNSKLTKDTRRQLNENVKIILEPIDLGKYTKISKFSYLLSLPLSTSASKMPSIKLTNNSPETIYPYESLTRKKYEEIASRRASPSPENISKLNLFRNIFLENNPFLFANSNSQSNSCFRASYNSNSRYYKLNELVSVKINEDYFREKLYQALTPDDSMDIDDEFNEDTSFMLTSTPQFKN
jgi:hypothetical protein